MQWSRRARLFGIRLLVCLVLAGAGYAAVFGLRTAAKPVILTPPQKLAELRAALDETYLAGNSLASFKQSDGTAFQALDDLRLQFEKSTNRLRASLSAAPADAVAPLKPAITNVLNQAQLASQSYRASNAVLTQIINYNPSANLDTPALANDPGTLAARASAAQKGLLKAAADQTTVAAGSTGLSVQNNNGPALIVNDPTRTLLRAEAACFGQLSTQASARQTTAMTQTRSQCVADYPALRRQAIQNITQSAWGNDYQSFTHGSVPPLLRQLDALIKTSSGVR